MKITSILGTKKWLFYFCCLFFAFCNMISAKELSQIKIEWTPIKGSNGYKLEIQDEKGNLRAEDFPSASAELALASGNYSIRVSGLNKFKKPSNWSDWKKITVKESKEVQKISMSKDTSEEEVSKIETPIWKKFIPGLTSYESGTKWKIYVYAGIFSGLSYYSYANKRQGDALAEKISNQNSYLFFTSYASSSALGPLAYMQRNSDRNLYDSHQTNQRNAGFAILGLYMISLVDSFYFSNIAKKLSLQYIPELGLNANVGQRIQWSVEFQF